MYEVRSLVSDNKLANVLRALSGLTFGLPTVRVAGDEDLPVAEVKSPTATPKKYRRKLANVGGVHKKGKGATEVVRTLIQESGVATISAREMKRATIKAGYSNGAYSHAIKLLKKDGLIKALDTTGDYEVVRAAA